MSRVVIEKLRWKQAEQAVQDEWVRRLSRSLRLTYITETDRPPKRGDRVTAHPEFDPAVVAQMDAELGRSMGSRIYSIAFRMCKPRADAMLDAFEAQQHAVNRRFFKTCLQRVAVFDPDLAALLAKPICKKNPRRDSNPQPCA